MNLYDNQKGDLMTTYSWAQGNDGYDLIVMEKGVYRGKTQLTIETKEEAQRAVQGLNIGFLSLSDVSTYVKNKTSS